MEHEQKIEKIGPPQRMDRGLNRGPPDLGGKKKSFGPLGLLLDLSSDERRSDPPSFASGVEVGPTTLWMQTPRDKATPPKRMKP